MQPASKRLAEVFETITFHDAKIPVVANVTATEVTKGEEIKESLIRQAAMPVLWETSVNHMIAGGVDTFVEVGPGKVLSGFTKKIAKGMLLEIVLLAFCFSVLKNFAGAFHASYISELCFLLVYCVMAVMLLQTFLLFQEVVSKSLESCVEFMKVMVPTFCLSMMFASNVSSAAGFYQTAFLVIYLVEWLFLNLLMPLIHIYVL